MHSVMSAVIKLNVPLRNTMYSVMSAVTKSFNRPGQTTSALQYTELQKK